MLVIAGGPFDDARVARPDVWSDWNVMPSGEPSNVLAYQCLRLIRAFLKVSNANKRRDILELMEWWAKEHDYPLVRKEELAANDP